MNLEQFMTEKERAIVYKRQRIAELRQQGMKHEQVWVRLNEELNELGFNTVALSYIYKYWSKVKNNVKGAI